VSPALKAERNHLMIREIDSKPARKKHIKNNNRLGIHISLSSTDSLLLVVEARVSLGTFLLFTSFNPRPSKGQQ